MRKVKNRTAKTAPAKATPAKKAANPQIDKRGDEKTNETKIERRNSARFVQPLQSPPAEREYLRAMVGRQANPALVLQRAASTGNKRRGSQADNYFVQLSTFHVRRRGF